MFKKIAIWFVVIFIILGLTASLVLPFLSPSGGSALGF